jgi:hypothetical protein
MVEAFHPNGTDPDPIIYELIEFVTIALRNLPEEQRPPKWAWKMLVEFALRGAPPKGKLSRRNWVWARMARMVTEQHNRISKEQDSRPISSPRVHAIMQEVLASLGYALSVEGVKAAIESGNAEGAAWKSRLIKAIRAEKAIRQAVRGDAETTLSIEQYGLRNLTDDELDDFLDWLVRREIY